MNVSFKQANGESPKLMVSQEKKIHQKLKF